MCANGASFTEYENVMSVIATRKNIGAYFIVNTYFIATYSSRFNRRQMNQSQTTSWITISNFFSLKKYQFLTGVNDTRFYLFSKAVFVSVPPTSYRPLTRQNLSNIYVIFCVFYINGRFIPCPPCLPDWLTNLNAHKNLTRSSDYSVRSDSHLHIL